MSWLVGTLVALALVEQGAAATLCSKRPYGEALLTPDATGPARLDVLHKATFVRAERDFRPVPEVSPNGKSYFIVRGRLGLQFGARGPFSRT